LQGLAPGRVELDASLYVSQDGDVTVELEGEYNLRLTQRLVLQPRAEVGLAAQDVSDRELGAGVTDANLDLRLRYEIRRELAPYLGARYRVLIGEARSRADADGRDEDLFFLVAGLRLAF
ncbi:MAG: copper resistance protein B, partial [bacterium]